MFLIIYVDDCILHIVCLMFWVINCLELLYLADWLEHSKHNFNVKCLSENY